MRGRRLRSFVSADSQFSQPCLLVEFYPRLRRRLGPRRRPHGRRPEVPRPQPEAHPGRPGPDRRGGRDAPPDRRRRLRLGRGRAARPRPPLPHAAKRLRPEAVRRVARRPRGRERLPLEERPAHRPRRLRPGEGAEAGPRPPRRPPRARGEGPGDLPEGPERRAREAPGLSGAPPRSEGSRLRAVVVRRVRRRPFSVPVSAVPSSDPGRQRPRPGAARGHWPQRHPAGGRSTPRA